MKVIQLLVFLFACYKECLGANILVMILTPSYSHQIVFKPLFKELSLRGHKLTVITTDPVNDAKLSNITEIDVKHAYKVLDEKLLEIIDSKNFIRYLHNHFKIYDAIVSSELEHPEVQKLIHNNKQTFDLFIGETMHPAIFAFSKHFKCPAIGVSSLDGNEVYLSALGLDKNPLGGIRLAPLRFDKNSLLGRLEEYLVYHISFWLFSDFKSAEQIVEKYFGKEYLPVQKLIDNIDMLFVNSDPIFHPNRPTVPAVVRIGGGAQIVPPKALSKDLQKILDNSKQGVIYFSLGSNVKSKDMPHEKISVILNTFAELPYTILWKFELEELPGKPENVYISKWFPQQDIMRHPNMKLFITHGGLQSLDETIHFKIPIVGMPVFCEQHYNIDRMIERGVGLAIDYDFIDKDKFKEVVYEVLDNSTYRNKITELSDLVKDEPMTGLEKAVWWTEYVIRNKGAKHLKSFLAGSSVYKYYLLDVYALLLLIGLMLVTVVILTLKWFYRIVKYIFVNEKIKTQ